MKTKLLKIGLVTGFIALISGLVLATIGVSTQGLEQLEAATAPKEIHLTYDKIDSLTVDTYNKQVVIEESPDQKVHVRYSEFTYLSQKLHISETAGQLGIFNTYAGVSNAYPVRSFGELLNMDKKDVDLLTIQIPKGRDLKELNANSYSLDDLEINDLNIKSLTLTGSPTLKNVSVEEGVITLTGYQLSIQDSQLKNTEIQNQFDGTVNLSNSQLENVKFAHLGTWSKFIADNLTLVGDLEIGGYYSTIDITLSDSSKTTTSLDISLDDMPKNTYYDEDLDEWVEDEDYPIDYSYGPSEPSSLTLSDQLKQDADITEELRFKKTVKDEKAKLRIVGLGGNQVTIK